MTLYDPRKSGRISRIERESGVKFEHLSAPQPIDIARSAGASAAESVTQVSDRYIHFKVYFDGYFSSFHAWI